MAEDINCGDWIFQEMHACPLPEDAATAFTKATAGIIGVSYTPVLFVATQLVAGMNYCFICKTTAATNPPLEGCKIVYIYDDLSHNAHITRIEEVIK